MKTSAVLYFFGLAGLAMAGPLKKKTEPDQSPNEAAKMPNWFLNCTGGQLFRCQELGTYCSNAWPVSNNAWCQLNCDCEYWDGCSDFSCVAETSEAQGALQ